MFDYASEFKKMRSGLEFSVAENLLGISTEIQSLQVTKKTLNLDLLPDLKHIKYLTAHDVDDVCFKQICLAKQITHLSINAYGVKDVDPLGNLSNLEGLEVTDNTKASSLAWLASLSSLKVLALANCPITVDISPIGSCKEIHFIWLSSAYSKPMRINSLDAFSGLARLENLRMQNTRVLDKRLSGLHSLENLAKIELPDFFPAKEFLALAAALPQATGRWLDLHKKKALERTAGLN
jgi:Leucine-rich repeat (LRR) protein